MRIKYDMNPRCQWYEDIWYKRRNREQRKHYGLIHGYVQYAYIHYRHLDTAKNMKIVWFSDIIIGIKYSRHFVSYIQQRAYIYVSLI